MQANLLLHNGRVYTMDPQAPFAQAVAVSGNWIVAVGDDSALRPLLAPGGLAIDLEGRAVTPGLIDAHVHFGSYSMGIHEGRVDLDNVPTKEEALSRVAEQVRSLPPGRWIKGRGWNKNVWLVPDLPTAADLDAIAPRHPVALQDKSIHSTWVNSRALELAGITASTEDPPGGEILRDDSGQPTGVLLETASELVDAVMPDPDVGSMVEALRIGIRSAHRLGLTGFHAPENGTVLAALQALKAQEELPIRALVHIPTDQLDAAVSLGLCSGLGDETLRIGGVKIFADGALGLQTAHMVAPYEGTADQLGIPTHDQARLCELVNHAHQNGISVTIHAIGDAANRAVLDAVEASAHESIAHPPALPDRMEHVQLLHEDDLGRLATLGIVASMQPIHATSDMEMAELHWGDRCRLSYAWKSVLQSGARLAFGSDCPVETLDPLLGIHAAVTRRRRDGSPGPEGWVPDQRVTVSEAVHAYTAGAAYASGESKVKGTLSAGKLADLVVLSRDIFEIDPMEILDTRVAMTFFDGRCVYPDAP